MICSYGMQASAKDSQSLQHIRKGLGWLISQKWILISWQVEMMTVLLNCGALTMYNFDENLLKDLEYSVELYSIL